MNNETRELSIDELDQVSAGGAMWCGVHSACPDRAVDHVPGLEAIYIAIMKAS
jgi:hypothetical protein